jgi:hypothetical protein
MRLFNAFFGAVVGVSFALVAIGILCLILVFWAYVGILGFDAVALVARYLAAIGSTAGALIGLFVGYATKEGKSRHFTRTWREYFNPFGW